MHTIIALDYHVSLIDWKDDTADLNSKGGSSGVTRDGEGLAIPGCGWFEKGSKGVGDAGGEPDLSCAGVELW